MKTMRRVEKLKAVETFFVVLDCGHENQIHFKKFNALLRKPGAKVRCETCVAVENAEHSHA